VSFIAFVLSTLLDQNVRRDRRADMPICDLYNKARNLQTSIVQLGSVQTTRSADLRDGRGFGFGEIWRVKKKGQVLISRQSKEKVRKSKLDPVPKPVFMSNFFAGHRSTRLGSAALASRSVNPSIETVYSLA
jgi:hypothetical protein